MSWLDRYVAIPFRDRGRSFEGVDCFGLYILMLANEAKVGIDEPDVSYERDGAAVASKVEYEIASGKWQLIASGDGSATKKAAQKFDCVVMSAHVRRGIAVVNSDLHIGIAVGGGFLIHTEKGVGCIYTAFDDPDVNSRIKGVYRPKALCS